MDSVKKDVYEVINNRFAEVLFVKHPHLQQYNITAVIEEFNNFLVDTITANREGISLPLYLGYLFMGAFPADKQFRKYRSICEDKRNLEKFSVQERDGHECRLVYTTVKTLNRFEKARYWGLDVSEGVKYRVTTAFKKDWKKYVVVPNIMFMKGVFSNSTPTARVFRKKAEALKTYNEFEF